MKHVLSTDVDVDPPIGIRRTVDGVRRVVPIRGGRAHGPHITGSVLNAGADFQ
ncbi:MAG TPA: DUF3237 family protein [Citricoccus sp.]|nr:DUF3237 family protein [Micrococcus sp. TA1]HRO28922.1 DUF3237 family protein [Citricoccus sp.]HRO94988.1 DUF3237 family protein [Citricoccus sp.]